MLVLTVPDPDLIEQVLGCPRVYEPNEQQTVELVDDLEALRVALERALSLARDEARPVSLDQQSVGRVSRMDALQQQALASNSRRSLELRLSQVRAALAAAEAGEYGDCKRCEEPIGYKRLKAKPEAPLCMDCQAGRERR